MTRDISHLLVSREIPIREVVGRIDESDEKIALVVDDEERLVATVTDGDVRRGLLAGISLDAPVERLLEERPPAPHPTPLTVPAGTPDAEILHLMKKYVLRHIPVVDGEGRVVNIALLNDLTRDQEEPPSLEAVVMAGGYGTRLRPLTEDVPKPMLPVGDRPILEHIIGRLRDAGISRVKVTTHYKGEVIEDHFGDGSGFGVDIEYVEEDRPLGTAGALSRVEVSDSPLLVINGDILTDLDFGAMLDYHREHGATMTVAAQEHEISVPFGVVKTEGSDVVEIVEKPVVRHFVNAGIYLLDPEACRFVPEGKSFDIPDLIQRLLEEDYRVVSFPLREYWTDIGEPDDYRRAISEYGEQTAEGLG